MGLPGNRNSDNCKMPGNVIGNGYNWYIGNGQDWNLIIALISVGNGSIGFGNGCNWYLEMAVNGI